MSAAVDRSGAGGRRLVARSDRQLDRAEAPGTPAAAGAVPPAAGRPGRRLGGRHPQDREVGDGAHDHHAAQAGRRPEPVGELLRRRGGRGERTGRVHHGRRAPDRLHLAPRDRPGGASPGRTAASSWPGRWPRWSRGRRAAPTPWSTPARSSSSSSRGHGVRGRRAGVPPGEGDSVHFRTDRPHRWGNPGNRPARAVWMALRPSLPGSWLRTEVLPLFAQPLAGRCRRGGERKDAP